MTTRTVVILCVLLTLAAVTTSWADQCMGLPVNLWVETRTHTETVCLQWNEPFPDDPTRCEEYWEYYPDECICVDEIQVERCVGTPLYERPLMVDVIQGSPCDDIIVAGMGDVVCAGAGDDTIVVHTSEVGPPTHIDSGPGNDYVGCSGQAVCLGE